ncbi:hypothetical protein DdX_06384 [Ditylenchus destructor]|uniref:Uncharacterized protein n=1 Tax=Ditylenchus destructor TaxID=166010 RepID=A0AAD4N7I7_9BILA|nr:hypothetical protein DdX_06384 [Ditylenchus destructor]
MFYQSHHSGVMQPQFTPIRHPAEEHQKSANEQILHNDSPLGSGRVIRQSLPLGETRRLVPVSPSTFATTEIYGFRKSGKSWMTMGAAMRLSRWVVLWNY